MVAPGQASLSCGFVVLDISTSLVWGMCGINLVNFLQTEFLFYDTFAWTLGNERGF
jgi:hypothetical protein